ncbi:MAG TPA: S-layer homology domain-containing protein, partial [Chloroflexia bacterium]|nr:S-layer homology domain-containing protein [Chloroflexia bacterium]
DTAFVSPTWGLRPNNNYGWGEIDDYAAAVYVRDAGTVAGTVMNTACSAPVAGAAMWVYDNTPGSRAQGVGIRKLVSDNNGQYATILAAGQYTVSISAPGFYGQNIPVSITSNTTTTLPIPLLKMATGTVSGTVTDGTSPVSGATVSVDGLSNVRTTTNAQGQYTLSNVPDGTFTIRAEQCGATGDSATVTVTYPNTVTRNFVVAAAPALLADDFESGTLNNWTVTGGSAVTGIWNPSTVRAVSGIYAARAGIPGSPSYTGTINTYMTSNTFDASASDRVWLSFNLYDSSESEYDIIRAQVSSNGGTTWVTVYGEASPVHGWQAICLDLTAWKSATMQIRFYFHTDSTNWNNEVFEGPSIDDVRFAANTPAGAPTNTPVVAMTPTPGTPIPCTPMPTATRTPVVATATPGATETPCPMTFSDVQPTDFFYTYVHYLYCHGVISGYADNTFRPYNNTTRGQMVKIVVLGFGKTIVVPPNNGYTFADVLPGSTFFPFVETAAAGNIVSGYACGGVGEPCDGQNRPYFRPGLNVTRGQLAKIDVVAAGWAQVTPATPTFADVPVTSPFYGYIEAIAARGIVSGYNCGSAGEPCDPQNRQYYRSGNNATRAQISKIVYLSITAP